MAANIWYTDGCICFEIEADKDDDGICSFLAELGEENLSHLVTISQGYGGTRIVCIAITDVRRRSDLNRRTASNG